MSLLTFHAKYGEYEAVVHIDGGVAEGRLPRRALRLVSEWREAHRDELAENWILARQRTAVA